MGKLKQTKEIVNNENKIFTIPNILSICRLVMVPFIFWSYINEQYLTSVLLILISGITDVIDGFIARTFNQISNLGKILDPLADKFTQVCVVLLILITNHTDMGLCVMFVILCIKEVSTLFFGTQLLSSGKTNIVSKWYGKLSTVILYATMTLYALIIALRKFEIIPPPVYWLDILATIFSWVTAAALIYSMVGYMSCYVINKENNKNSNNNSDNNLGDSK